MVTLVTSTGQNLYGRHIRRVKQGGNGSPAIWVRYPGYGDAAICFDIDGERIQRIWIVAAPEKLRAASVVMR